jgi:hypothetical protein
MSHIPPISMGVAATLAAYRGVTHLTGTAQQVKYPASIAELPIGITTNTVINTSDDIPVAIAGIAKLEFGDSCASGCLVALDSSGRGVAYTNNTAGGYVIGTLVGPSVQVVGAVGDVLIQPKWKIIT